jgi:hypothetical protein
MERVREAIYNCWATRPSLRALAGQDKALFQSAMNLVEHNRWKMGELPTVIEAVLSTLNANDYQPVPHRVLEPWSFGRVDPEVLLTPPAAASTSLRDAIEAGETLRDRIQIRLDDVARKLPIEERLPDMDANDVRMYIAESRWRAARPPQPPHEYTIRDWRPDHRLTFLAMALLIQSNGELKLWGGYVRAYLTLDGLEYWTMGARVAETLVINRALVGAAEAARSLAAVPRDSRLRAIENSLAYRRASMDSDLAINGALGQRLLAALT